MGRIILLDKDYKSCDHPTCEVSFDINEAADMSAFEIQKRWPRFDGICPDCGHRIIKYASMEHYTYGDW